MICSGCPGGRPIGRMLSANKNDGGVGPEHPLSEGGTPRGGAFPLVVGEGILSLRTNGVQAIFPTHDIFVCR